MQVLQEQKPIPEVAGTIIFFISGAGDGFI
ncbi:MAG: hypothetical protein ACI84K_001558 [Pseudohongiellaceae bacterium]|jgi:hypothetical protein